MKKIITVITCFFALATTVYAQDTMQYMDPCYLFNERHPYTVRTNFSSFWSWNELCCYQSPDGYLYSLCYPISNLQEPVLVYGVALTIEGPDRRVLKEEDLVESRYDVVISAIENNRLVVIDSTTWNTDKDAQEYFKYTMRGGGVLYEETVPVYEFYFETPHLMSDTFYVGFRRHDDYHNDWELNISIDSMQSIWIQNDNLFISPDNEHVWGGEFPILQPNRRCHAPTSAPQIIIYNATNTVRFTLPYETGDSLLLSIARAGQSADSGDIYPVSGTTMDIVVPDSGRYSARLARVCHRDIDVQSRWSEASNFQIYNSLGIAPRHDGLSPALLIYPNPASGTVTIGCESANGTIELMDMQGRTLQQVPAGKHTLDISSLATGIYLVRLTSDKGTTVRQLHVK